MALPLKKDKLVTFSTFLGKKCQIINEESLTSCLKVNSSWRLFINDPIFWLNRMKKSSSVSEILHLQWKEFHQNTKNSELEQNFDSLIIGMKDDILAPLHAAAKFG